MQLFETLDFSSRERNCPGFYDAAMESRLSIMESRIWVAQGCVAFLFFQILPVIMSIHRFVLLSLLVFSPTSLDFIFISTFQELFYLSNSFARESLMNSVIIHVNVGVRVHIHSHRQSRLIL